MEYIILVCLVILILITLVMFFKMISSKTDLEVLERLAKFEMSINDRNIEFERNLNRSFDVVSEKLDRKLNLIYDNVNNRLDDNFKKSNDTFRNILERLATIDSAQKKIDNLSTDIISLQSVLTDKKSRGIFGEVSLNHILYNIFGDNSKLYSIQQKLSNGYIVDCMLYAPLPLGSIAIDSKFPLENYQNMVDKTINVEDRKRYEKQFKLDFKKHVDDIANKYIIKEETSDQAIMFLPAEAIFAEINAYHQDLIDYAYNKRVWITSPTTLISKLTVIEMILKNIERDKYTSIIHQELNKLGNDFRLYKERWDKLARSVKTVNNDIDQVYITTEKISKKFENISQVKIENDNLLEEKIND